MHAAAKDIPIRLYSRIKSIVMFGDPYHRLGDIFSRFPVGLNNKVMQICADGDPVRTKFCLVSCRLAEVRSFSVLAH